jgi:glycosyltransferase involved in cell wall biosynthesis
MPYGGRILSETYKQIDHLANKKVCILGCHSGQVDEGMGNVSYYLFHNLKFASGAEFVMLDLHDIWTRAFWTTIIASNLDIIHYVTGPSIWGMGFAKVLQKLTGSKLVISASGPVLPSFFRKISWLFRPDLVIVQSDRSESLFRGANYETTFVPNGVDTQRFSPVELATKRQLRKKYGFHPDDFIILHVGSITKRRNVESLMNLKHEKVLLVVNNNRKQIEDQVYRNILDNGPNVTILREYFPNIQEIYALADVYIFPIFDDTKLNAIDIPLSVLEAMSCNLPVITTRFAGLDRVLDAGGGLFFVEDEYEIKDIVKEIKEGKIRINTREKILQLRLSWKDISFAVSNIYENLIR